MTNEVEVCWKRSKFLYDNFSDLYFISIFNMFYSLYEDPKMKFENVIKIPVYDSYRMVLVFPSSPFPPLTSPCNLKVSFKTRIKNSSKKIVEFYIDSCTEVKVNLGTSTMVRGHSSFRRTCFKP